MKDFKIIIPTYNRKKRLINELNSIFKQKLSAEIQILILDNHSTYDVRKTIEDNFTQKERESIDVITHKFNVGGAINIALPFYFCDTKWLWILSDDDETTDNSLSIIFDDLDKYSDAAVIKYSFNTCIYEDKTFSKIQDLIDYKNAGHDVWSIVFCSNAIYNMDKIRPYVGAIIEYSYNSVAAVMPILLTLDSESGDVLFRKEKIVHYIEADPGTGWNDLKLSLAVPSFWDYPFNMSGKTLLELWKPGLDSFPHFMETFEKNDMRKDKVRCMLYYKKTFPILFQNGFFLRIIYRTIFYFYYYFGISTIHKYVQISRLIKKIYNK